MARVSFTANVQRHVDCPPIEAGGATVGEVLRRAFEMNPEAKSYFVDDQFHVRNHVVVFVDGEPIRDRTTLTDPVQPNSEVYLMQAPSGG